MSREILLLVDALAHEKTVEKEIIFMALELALASATKKRFQEDIDIRVSINRQTGDYESFRRWLVVDNGAIENSIRQITLDDAQKIHNTIQLNASLPGRLETVLVGREAAAPPRLVTCGRVNTGDG